MLKSSLCVFFLLSWAVFGAAHNEEASLQDLIQRAELGDAEAQCDLGQVHGLGKIVSKSYEEAAKWYLRSAEQGFSRAQYLLGLLHKYGLGVEEKVELAAHLFMQAADQGYRPAQFELAYLYEMGEGVEKNRDTALFWYKKAAKQNDVIAQFKLATEYISNTPKMMKWLTRAAEGGLADAQFTLGNFLFTDSSESFKWFFRAGESGHKNAQYMLGVCYEFGHGVADSYEDAIKWYLKAAEQGSYAAHGALGEILCKKGKYEEGVKWLRSSAEKGYFSSVSALNDLYKKGRVVDPEFARAIEWYIQNPHMNLLDYFLLPYPITINEFRTASIVSHYMTHFQEIMDHWNRQLNASDRSILNHVATFLHENYTALGFLEESDLIQIAISRLTVLNLETTDPKSPWKIWNDLLEKRKVAVNLDSEMPFMMIGAKRVQLKPSVIASLGQNAQIVLESVPVIAPNYLHTALNAISLTPDIATQIREISSVHNEGTPLSLEGIKKKVLGDHGITFFTTLLTGTSELSCQFKCLLNHVEHLDNEGSFSLRQQQLINVLSAIRECDAGKTGDIAELYKNLPQEFKLRTTRGVFEGETVEVQQAKSLMIDLIREVVTTLIDTDNAFMKQVCGEEGPIEQLAHQSIYIKNLVGDNLGLMHKPSFDHHAQVLYMPMLEKSKEEVLRTFYDFANRDFCVALAYKINQAVMSSNAYLLLSELTSAWTVNEEENKVITPEGVVELLLAIGVLEEDKNAVLPW